VHACGNGLKLSSTRSTGEGFVWNQQLASNGIASYAVNPKSRYVVCRSQLRVPSIAASRRVVCVYFARQAYCGGRAISTALDHTVSAP